MVNEIGIQEQDYVVVKDSGDFVVSQLLDGTLTEIERATHSAAAEARAKALAQEEQSDAWIEEAPEVYRLL